MSLGWLGSLSGVLNFPKKLSAPAREFWLDSSRSLEVRLPRRVLLIRICGLNDFEEASSADFWSTSSTYAGYSVFLSLGLETESCDSIAMLLEHSDLDVHWLKPFLSVTLASLLRIPVAFANSPSRPATSFASLALFSSAAAESTLDYAVVAGVLRDRAWLSRMEANGSSCSLLDRFELNLFLMALSVLPGTSFAMSHHLFP